MCRAHPSDYSMYYTKAWTEDIQRHVREQALTVLGGTGKNVDVLDVGLDEDIESRVNTLISSILPAEFIPDVN